MGETINLSRFIPKILLNLFQGQSIYNNSYMLGQVGPIWIPVTDGFKLYSTIPELKSVIDRDATMFSNMKLYKRNKKTKDIVEDSELDALLNNPNCTQAQNQFLKQYRAQLVTYGNQFIYRNKVNSGKYPIALWNISPLYVQPVLTGKLLDQVKMDGAIKKYDLINVINNPFTRGFEPSEILFSRIPDLNNPIIGRSPISSLQYPLSNIEAAYKASNVAMQHVGVGIVSPRTIKDMAGAIPLNPKQRDDMEKQFAADYGIGLDQRRTILSSASVDFQSMAVDARKSLLKEEISADMECICNVLNMNPQMFLTNTTYENLRASIVQCYQDNIIPAADEFVQALSPFVGLKDTEELVASFEHLSILKENKLKGMQAIQAIVAALTQAVEAGLLDPKDATTIFSNELGLSAASF